VGDPAFVSLDQSTLDDYVQGPGVALVGWSDSRFPPTQALESELARAAAVHPDARWGSVDLARDESVAHAWEVHSVPTVMAFRDGILVFRHTGLMTEPDLAALLSAVYALDMESLRSSVDGKSSRIAVLFHPGDDDPFESGTESGGGGTAPGRRSS
jgi:thioredoxin 1